MRSTQVKVRQSRGEQRLTGGGVPGTQRLGLAEVPVVSLLPSHSVFSFIACSAVMEMDPMVVIILRWPARVPPPWLYMSHLGWTVNMMDFASVIRLYHMTKVKVF